MEVHNEHSQPKWVKFGDKNEFAVDKEAHLHAMNSCKRKHTELMNSSERRHNELMNSYERKHNEVMHSCEIKHEVMNIFEKNNEVMNSCERKHNEVINSCERRHNEVINSCERSHTEVINSCERRHNEVINSCERRHNEVMNSYERRYNEMLISPERKHNEINLFGRKHDEIPNCSETDHDDTKSSYEMSLATPKIMTIPCEILTQIFSYLSYEDLYMVVLVCRHWKEVGEEPKLWKRFVLTVTEENADILNRSRMAALETVRTSNRVSSRTLNSLFTIIGQKPNIKCLKIHNCTRMTETFIQTSINSQVLSKCFNGLEEVELNLLKLTSRQATDLFENMDKDTKLKELKLACIDLSTVDPEMLARCLNNLHIVEICGSGLNNQQALALFKVMNREPEFEDLSINEKDLSLFAPKPLPQWIAKLPGRNFTDILGRHHNRKQLWEVTLLKHGEGLRSCRFIFTPQCVSQWWLF